MWKNKLIVGRIYLHEKEVELIFIIGILLFQCLCSLLATTYRHVFIYLLLVSLVCACFYIIVSFVQVYRRYKMHATLHDKIKMQQTLLQPRVIPEYTIDELSIENLFLVWRENQVIRHRQNDYTEQLINYYTRWMHQIKTPISALKLLNESNTSSMTPLIEQELLKIEQYVDVALQYQRANAESTDYYFSRVSLKKLVHEVIKKLSILFIYNKIQVQVIIDEDEQLVTDSKWLSFVLEQIMTNAVKYAGRKEDKKITVYMKNQTLYIKDNGIGISPEMLPRIFEWSFTGANGRLKENSTGIGLALCQQIVEKLGAHLEIESIVGKGTEVGIAFDKQVAIFE